MRRFDKRMVKPGDRVIYRDRPDVPLVFKFMAHFGAVVVCLAPDFMPEHSARDVILKQKDLALPEVTE